METLKYHVLLKTRTRKISSTDDDDMIQDTPNLLHKGGKDDGIHVYDQHED